MVKTLETFPLSSMHIKAHKQVETDHCFTNSVMLLQQSTLEIHHNI